MSKYSCPQATNSAQKKRRPPGRRSSKYLGKDKLITREGFCSKTEEQAEEQAMAATLKALTAAISQADQAITELIAGDEPLTLLYAQLTSVPGVGLVLATETLLTTNAFRDRTDPKRYAGVLPSERSSGQHWGQPRVSAPANKRVKALLHLAALSAMRWCKPLKAYYERKGAEGKNKMLVLQNVRNKLVRLLFACVQKNQKYDENYAPALV